MLIHSNAGSIQESRPLSRKFRGSYVKLMAVFNLKGSQNKLKFKTQKNNIKYNHYSLSLVNKTENSTLQ